MDSPNVICLILLQRLPILIIWLGFILFGLSLVFILGGIELFGSGSISLLLPILTLLIGVLLLFGYGWHAAKKEQPLIPLSLFKTRTFNVGIRGNILSRLIWYCPYLVPLITGGNGNVCVICWMYDGTVSDWCFAG